MRHKGIIFDSKDHPDGLATLIIADGCTHGCKNCINEHLKNLPTLDDDPLYIIHRSILHCLNRLVVLGGLEWTENEKELYEFLDNLLIPSLGIRVILYTHWSEEEVKIKFPKLLEYNMWIKYGTYIPELASSSYYSCGIPLASTNQYIKKNIVDKK